MGRKLGTPAGGTADEYLGVVLMKKGVPREKLQVLNVPPGNIVSALQGGSVDAVACWEPFASQIEAKIPDAVLLSRGGGHIGYFINMAVRNEIIDRQPDLVEKYVIGMAEATWHTRKYPDEAAEISTRWIPGLDLAVAKKALAQMVFDARITPNTVAAWDENVKILIEQKKLKSAIPSQQGLELKFIEKVMKTHPQKGYKIMSQIPAMKDFLPGMYMHHEMVNGMGYPQGLTDEQIRTAGFSGGKLLFLLQRWEIEGRTAEEVARALRAGFERIPAVA